MGHPAKIRAAETRKQKHDRRDGLPALRLLREERFPTIGMPSTKQRDLRAQLRDRHQWVKMRTRVQSTLQAIALNHGLRKGKALWSQAGVACLEALPLPLYTGQRRNELLRLYGELQKRIQELNQQVEQAAERRPQAPRLLTHPWVGPERFGRRNSGCANGVKSPPWPRLASGAINEFYERGCQETFSSLDRSRRSSRDVQPLM